MVVRLGDGGLCERRLEEQHAEDGEPEGSALQQVGTQAFGGRRGERDGGRGLAVGGHGVREVAGCGRHDDGVLGAFGGHDRALAGGNGELAVTPLDRGGLGQLQRER